MYSEVPWRLIKSLSRKKERDRSGLTIAEGPSVVLSALKAQIEVHAVILARDFADSEKSAAIRRILTKSPIIVRCLQFPETSTTRCRIPEHPRVQCAL